jgi:threonine synthase
MLSQPSCASCGSHLVHPQRWHQRKDGELLVELRCPECFTVTQTCHTQEEMEELDRRQSASREQLVAAYERAVTENMEAMAGSLREALARDLVGADDFAPRALRRRSGPDSLPRAA